MPASINHKICDNASACGGISVCPVGAFKYNEDTKRIEIDNSKCISCGLCAKTCPIGAIGVAKTQEEFEELKQAIEEDPRKPEDLFVDRYGADIINENSFIENNEIDNKVKTGKTLIEVIDLDQARCLIKSIPFKEIISNTHYDKYYRILWNNETVKKYNLKESPTMLCFENGKFIKNVEGYFEDSQKTEFFNKLK